MRGNMMRAAVVMAAFAVVGSGCQGCMQTPPNPTCTDTTVTFETPTSGMTVDSPFEVSVNVKNADGSAFNIDAATLSVAGNSVTGTVSGNRATFAGVTAPAGAQSLQVTIARETCAKAVTSMITVRDACTTPAVSAVSFPQDTAAGGLGILNGTELPQGSNLQIKVDASCVSGVQVRIKRGAATVGGPVDFTNGSATLTLATLPDSDNATYDLVAELVRGGTVLNPNDSRAQASIRVIRTRPTVTLTTPASFGPMDDADSATAGFQARITGTAPPDTTCTINVMGQPTRSGVVPTMTGDVSADFTLTSGTYSVTLTCTDAAGNSGSAMATITVDFTPPTVVITSPVNVDGGATMVVTASPLSVTVSTTGAEDGSVVEVLRNGMSVDTGTITNGMATLAVPFGIDGTYTITVRVTDLAGNAQTSSITVVVTLSGCGATFSRPVACPALLTRAQMPSGTYTFQTTSNAICSGQPAQLFRTDVLADGGMTAEVAAGATTLAASGMANFPPLMLATGDYVFRGEVVNPGDAGVSVVTCDVTVDLDGPSITNPPVAITLRAVDDTQPMTPGVQRTLGYSARVPQGGRVDVCTTQPIDPVTMNGRSTSAECGAGWYVLVTGVSTSPVSGFTFPDGSYSIKIVVVGGGLATPPESAPIALVVDSKLPCLTSMSRRLPQDGNGDARLNIAELNGATPQLEFSLGCGDTGPMDLSSVVVRDVVAGALGAPRASTATFAAGKYTVALTGPYASEVDLVLWVELTDVAGNRNAFSTADFTFRVDPVAPTCDITNPGAATTLVGQAGAPSGMFNVLVATSQDVGTNGVRLTFGNQAPRDLTPTNGSVQTTYSLTGTSTNAIGATCTDSAGNATTATTRNVTIDLDAPTCAITAPTNAMPYMVSQIATSITVGGADGQPVTMRSNLQGSPLTPTLTVSGGVAAGNVTYPNGTQTITAQVSDLAGNSCTATVANVVIASSSCALALTNVFNNLAGSWFNRSNTGSLGATSGVVAAVNANSSDCRAGQVVTLLRTAPTMGTPSTANTSAAGDVSFMNVAVNDGETWTVTINNGAGILTTQTFRVGLRVPSAAGVAINGNTLTTGQPLFFVAATGNVNLDAVATSGMPKLTTYFPDSSASTDAQANLAATTVAGTRYGTDNGSLQVIYGASTVLTQTLMTDPFDLSSTSVTLGHATTGTFVVRVTSAAGNSADVISNAATVDVIAPAAPTISQSVSNVRNATASLSWAPVYDDGSDSASGGLVGGPPLQLAGYDVRWTTGSVPSNNSMLTVADYFGSASKQDGITAWSASTINKALTLPPINTYFIGIRARDDVGNYSAYTAPTALTNPWSTTVLTAPTASTSFGASMVAAGLMGNDSSLDLVVSATGVAGGGAVYVYDSSLLGSSQAGCPVIGCQALTPSDTAPGAFGSDLSVGEVGAVAGETKPDLLVSQTWSTAGANGGRAVIYFGTTAATLSVANSVEFRGDTTNRIGFSGAILKDIDGDGLDEIAFALPTVNATRGRIYIYKGRSQAAWTAAGLRTGQDATTMVRFIPVGTNADWAIDGASSGTLNTVGLNRRGLISVADLDGDTFPDIAIPTSRLTMNKYRVFGSATVKTSTGATPLDGTSNFRLELNEPVGADSSSLSGIGASSLSGNFIGASGLDLVTSMPGAGGGGQVLMVSGVVAPTTPTVNPAYAFRLVGPLSFGQAISMGNIDGDANPDLIGATAQSTGNAAHLLYQSSATFETNIVAAFWQSRFDGAAITSNVNSRLGGSSLLLDVSGDGSSDVVLGDSSTGEVRIWK